MSIEALKASLPDLTNEKFDQVYRQFFLKALGPVLGYERDKSAEDWDQVMDVFAAERERRERIKELVPKYDSARRMGRFLPALQQPNPLQAVPAARRGFLLRMLQIACDGANRLQTHSTAMPKSSHQG